MISKSKTFIHRWSDILQSVEDRPVSQSATVGHNSKQYDESTLAKLPDPAKQYWVKGKQYNHIRLTPREYQTFYWINEGLTTANIAKIIGLSARTVEFYVRLLRGKFNCRNKRELRQLIAKYQLRIIEKQKP